MKLSELLRRIHPLHASGPADGEVTGITHDSRQVKPGFVFFALQGTKTDGNRHIKEALRSGAIAVVSELKVPPAPVSLSAAWVEVDDMASAMGALADLFYGHPSGAFKVFGVTGTNGKTTTTYFLESIIAACGGKAAVAGTINYRLGGKVIESAVNTTPIAPHLQRLMAQFRDQGATHVAMEVSSHALALGRVDEIEFDAAIFTNLYRDHLDFHKTREDYFKAKARLFELLCHVGSTKKNRVAVINQDDVYCENLKRLCLDVPVLTFGLKGGDLRAENLEASPEGTRFVLVYKGKPLAAKISLVGEYNVYNALGAAGACLGLGMDPEGILRGLSDLRQVPGRLEPVQAGNGQDFHVFVDYAHTDSALEEVLKTLKKIPHQKLITVVGCGGDRDKTKRGPMGVAACASSDMVLITSDNPRGEDPAAIIADIEAGLRTSGRKNYKIQEDRQTAIEEAVRLARKGDIILIAGKGHENYQILKDKTIHFDDGEIARAALQARFS